MELKLKVESGKWKVKLVCSPLRWRRGGFLFADKRIKRRGSGFFSHYNILLECCASFLN